MDDRDAAANLIELPPVPTTAEPITHGLPNKIRTNHVRSRMRGPYLAPESINTASGLMDDSDPLLTGALALSAGDQVLAVALPALNELRLLTAADALPELTGTQTADDVDPVVTAAPSTGGVAQAFVAAWQTDSAGSGT